ncbi:MAG TPA: dihydropteroate synthase [Candidatus Hydrogenedentes bacterium]|nr:dihydropteroate synthase [Candidatus Hydrogenedentota bacterium]
MNPGKTRIMGIVNVTPDSFFDGGRWDAPEAAVAHARQLVLDGADILDIGGESSRPGADPVPPDLELARVLPVVEGLAGGGTPLSVDTCRAETARRCLAAGAWMVNDITALRGDPAMAGTVAAAGCPVVLMHMQGTPKTMQAAPRYTDVVDDLCAFFEERLAFAAAAGVREENVWLDPGFGFGKTVNQNLEILRRLDAFHRFGRPLLVGTSNKSTVGAVLGLPPDQRTEGTAATVAFAVARGVHCVRVHDVRTMARVARMCDAILRGSAETND